MVRYKETIRPSISVILKKYFFYFALPCLIFLPVTTQVLLNFFLPQNTAAVMVWKIESIIQMYFRSYTSPFLFFVIPVLIFLAWISYCNTVHSIRIRNNRLFLPIRTGGLESSAGHEVTVIPFENITSFELSNIDSKTIKDSSVKRYRINIFKEYTGDWAIVQFYRHKIGQKLMNAFLIKEPSSKDIEHVEIIFPVKNFKKINSIIFEKKLQA